jgi:hypothetical protein
MSHRFPAIIAQRMSVHVLSPEGGKNFSPFIFLEPINCTSHCEHEEHLKKFKKRRSPHQDHFPCFRPLLHTQTQTPLLSASITTLASN